MGGIGAVEAGTGHPKGGFSRHVVLLVSIVMIVLCMCFLFSVLSFSFENVVAVSTAEMSCQYGCMAETKEICVCSIAFLD